MASRALRLARSSSSSTIKHYLRSSRNIRTYASMCDESREPCMSSISFSMKERFKYFNLNCPGLTKTESDEELCVFGNMAGLKKEDMKAPCIEYTPHVLIIEGYKHEAVYLASMELPDNVDDIIKTEMQDDGMLKVTLSKVKDRQLKKKKPNIFIQILTALGFRFIPSVIMACGRSYIVMRLCSSWFESITMCKKETPKSLHVSCTPGIEKTTKALSSEGVWVSLNMSELKIEDVTSFVKYGILFIEGKTKTKTNKVHYITGIRLPPGFDKWKIKTEMQDDGMFNITLLKAKDNKTSIISNIITNSVTKRMCSVHDNKGWSSWIVSRLSGLVLKWVGSETRLRKNSPNELEIEFPVNGVGSEARVEIKVDVKNRLILLVKDNNNDIFYNYCQELPRCGNFEKAVFKATLFAGLVTVNVKNFQKEEVVVGFD